MDCIPFAPRTSPELALSGGEEYELLVTAPAFDADAFQREFGIPLTCIGSVAPGAPAVTVTKGGKRVAVPAGFDHLKTK